MSYPAKPRPRRVDLEMVDLDLIQMTNTRLDASVVAGIVAAGIDPDKFGALPAYFNGTKWIITDGNHRFAAARILCVECVPVAPLTRAEFNWIAASKTHCVDLLVRVPANPRYHYSTT